MSREMKAGGGGEEGMEGPHWKEAEWCVGQEDHSTERERWWMLEGE